MAEPDRENYPPTLENKPYVSVVVKDDLFSPLLNKFINKFGDLIFLRSCQLWWEQWHPLHSLSQPCVQTGVEQDSFHNLISVICPKVHNKYDNSWWAYYWPAHLKLWVLTDDLGSEEAGLVVPLDSIPVPDPPSMSEISRGLFDLLLMTSGIWKGF